MPDAAAFRIAVTGVNGFVGRHVAAELADHGIAVVGIGIQDQAAVDLDAYFSADLVAEWPSIGPVDAVIHLAGLAAVGPSFDEPQRYLTVNSSIVTNMGEALVASSSKARVVLVSSGAIYDGNQPLPLTERSSVDINSPYAISKVLNEIQASYYRGRGLDCVIARPFNHIGPGQGPGFLLPDLAAALARAGHEPLLVGNLSTKRDYTDVRDVARAYRLLATQPELGHQVYNICSGRSLSGNDILAGLLKASGRSEVHTETDSARLRPNDPVDIVGDNSRLRKDTGWAPQNNIGDTISDYLRHR